MSKDLNAPESIREGKRARAVVNEPPPLLAVEPTGALDTRAGGEVMNVLLVTHNPDNAARAGRVLHLRDGRRSGETAALFTQTTTVKGYDRALITEER